MSILDQKCEHGVYNPNRDGAACDQCQSKFRRSARPIRFADDEDGMPDDLQTRSQQMFGLLFGSGRTLWDE